MMIIISLGSLMMISVAKNITFAYEKYTPREHWFHYDSVKPVRDWFHVSEFPKFTSQASWYRNGSVEWADYLVCIEGGELVTYDIDPDFRVITDAPIQKNYSKFWEIDSQSFKDSTERCKANIVVIFRTPQHKIEKIQMFPTAWFDVTHD